MSERDWERRDLNFRYRKFKIELNPSIHPSTPNHPSNIYNQLHTQPNLVQHLPRRGEGGLFSSARQPKQAKYFKTQHPHPKTRSNSKHPTQPLQPLQPCSTAQLCRPPQRVESREGGGAEKAQKVQYKQLLQRKIQPPLISFVGIDHIIQTIAKQTNQTRPERGRGG